MQEVKDKIFNKNGTIKSEIPIDTIKKILYSCGVINITDNGLEEVRTIIESIIRDIGYEIVVFTKHRGSSESTLEDVRMAIR